MHPARVLSAGRVRRTYAIGVTRRKPWLQIVLQLAGRRCGYRPDPDGPPDRRPHGS